MANQHMAPKENKPSLNGITKSALLQATDKLQIAVRERMKLLGIPLNSKISIEPRSDNPENNPTKPMGREIWVSQRWPIKRRFRLCYDELSIVETEGGFGVEQTIFYDELP